MKKAIIAGASAAVLAAMPIMGVFAASGDNITDVITATLSESCTMKSGDNSATAAGYTNNIAEATLGAGNTTEVTGSTITVNCNAYTKGWYVKAEGASTPGAVTGATVTSLVPQTNTASSAPIATGTTGEDSHWYMTVASTSDSGLLSETFYASGASVNAVIPGAEGATVMTGAKNTPAAATDNDGASFTATYHIYTSYAQQADTYKGAVKYTLVSPSN